MSQPTPDTTLEQQTRWLLEQLTQSTRTFLEMAEHLEALAPDSSEAAEQLGLIYARVQQVRMDAEDVIEAMDADDPGGSEGAE